MLAALSMAVSCFVGFASGASADEILEPISCSVSAGFTDNGTNSVYNASDAETTQRVGWNNRSGQWKGVAVLEFELPAYSADRVKSVTLSYNVKNEGSRKGDRTYDVYQADVDISDESSYVENMQTIALSSSMYTGASLAMGASRDDTIPSDNIIDYVKGKMNASATSTIQFAFSNSAQVLSIDPTTAKLNITLYDAGAQSADYTINYMCASETVKTVTGSDVVGNTPEVDMTSFMAENGKKYDCVTSNVTALIDGTNVFTVTCIETTKHNVSVNAVDGEGNVLQQLYTAEQVYNGESVTYTFPEYMIVSGKLYQIDNGGNNGYFRNTDVVTEDTATKTLTYTLVEDSTPVYYSEAEDIEGMTEAPGNNGAIRCSEGSGAYAGNDVTITTLDAGIYKMKATAFGHSNTNTATFDIQAGTDTVLSVTTAGGITANTEVFEVAADGTPIVIKAAGQGGSSSRVLDYILIEKVTPAISATYADAKLEEAITATSAEDASTTEEFAAGTEVRTYTIKVDNYLNSLDTPVLNINGEYAQATAELEYGYADGTTHYFIYQVIGEHTAPETVSIGEYTGTVTPVAAE